MQANAPTDKYIMTQNHEHRNDTNQIRAVSATPLGLNKCVSTINPGLAPWALQEYRPCRALCGNEYDVLTMISTRKYFSKYAHLFQ